MLDERDESTGIVAGLLIGLVIAILIALLWFVTGGPGAATKLLDATSTASGATSGTPSATSNAASKAAAAAGAAAAASTSAPAATASAPAAAPAAEVDKEPTRLVGTNYPEAVSFFFDSGKFGVEVGAQDKIKNIVEWAIKDPNSKIGLSGYHDKTGDPAANRELAKNRAKSVRELLLASGVPQDRIIMVKPQETTGGGDDRQARRVDVYPAQ